MHRAHGMNAVIALRRALVGVGVGDTVVDRRGWLDGDFLDGNRANRRFVSGWVDTLTSGHGPAVPMSLATHYGRGKNDAQWRELRR